MKTLADILYKVPIVQVFGTTHQEVDAIVFDSRKATAQKVFVAVKGTTADGHDFIDQVVRQGCTAIVCEKFPDVKLSDVTYIQVNDSAYALGLMADTFYEAPSSKLKVVAVTGTNGKTTIATLLFRLFCSLNYKCGLISTVENRINEKIIPSTHTTPDVVALNALMNEMVMQGCTHCFMEASSHAIEQQRMAGLSLCGALFTNLTHDHLDYHKTFANYLNAKKKLFDGLNTNAFAVSNADDKNGGVMLQNCKAKKYFYSILKPSDFTARVMENSFSGLSLKIDEQEVYTNLVGNFNASNLLAIYAAAVLLGVNKTDALVAISKLQPAEGRFDYVTSEKEKVIGIVDYAHTPDALQKVLETIQGIRTGNETLITIVGCGGNRDAAKRPVMAATAAEKSDKVILTSDNPRNENPNDILKEMQAGISPARSNRVMTIADRHEAIKVAVTLAQRGDIILLAGKGHEKYQEINGVKYPFDDKQQLIDSFKSIGK